MHSQCLQIKRNKTLFSLDLEPGTLLGLFISLNIHSTPFEDYCPLFLIKTLQGGKFKYLLQGHTINR